MRKGRIACAGIILAGIAGLTGASRATAASSPMAELSINPSSGALTVSFVAKSTGFPSPVNFYVWSFGDGHTRGCNCRTVTHTYSSTTTFPVSVSVTETDANSDSAKASGTLMVALCPVGTTSCSESLQGASNVIDLTVSGSTSPPAQGVVQLFVGPFQIANCEPQVSPAAAFTDSGFTGTLKVTLTYTTSHPGQVETTCFASTKKFFDASGQSVNSGPLPFCNAAGAGPPCVIFPITTGPPVSKMLLVPAGDPKVGGP
jgi:hypothetical protein